MPKVITIILPDDAVVDFKDTPEVVEVVAEEPTVPEVAPVIEEVPTVAPEEVV